MPVPWAKSVPKEPGTQPAQLRAAGDRRGDPRRGAAVRAQGQRLDEASRANEEPFQRAVEAVAAATKELHAELTTSAALRDREREAARARARAAARLGTAA
jgi:hypothetical protein